MSKFLFFRSSKKYKREDRAYEIFQGAGCPLAVPPHAREQIDTLEQPAEGNVFLFTIEGFCEQNPTFFICRKEEGLRIGYYCVSENPADSPPVPVERYLIEWHVLES